MDEELNKTRFSQNASPAGLAQHYRPGVTVGSDYLLERFIGQGGMGLVFAATHKIIKQKYAIKILAPELLNDQNWLRFQREAQALAKLNHPTIVQVFNLGIDNERCPFCVMEYIDGTSLEDFLRKNGPLPILDALEVFYQVASALDAAHKNRIVHRDIKPGNIMLVKNPQPGQSPVKLVDFGLARMQVEKDPFGLEKRTASDALQFLTGKGDVFGSPFYMSPEQCRGEEVDRRTDYYSLGCSFFEALTGKVPFAGDSVFETLKMHENASPPTLKQAAPHLTFMPALEDMLAKMLAKSPDQRYQSAADIMHDMDRLFLGRTVTKSKAITTISPAPYSEPLFEPDEEPQEIPVPKKNVKALTISALALALFMAGGAAALLQTQQQTNISAEKQKKLVDGLGAYVPPKEDAVRDRKDENKFILATRDQKNLTENRARFTFLECYDYAEIGDRHHRLKYLPGDPVVVEFPMFFQFSLTSLPVKCLNCFAPKDISVLRVECLEKDEDWLELMTILRKWKKLDRLEFRRTILPDTFVDDINQLSSIRGLELRHCHFSNKTMDAFSRYRATNTVGLSECRDKNDEGREADMTRFFAAIAKTSQVLNLELIKTGLNSRCISVFPQLKKLSILTVLKYNWTRPDLENISKMPALTRITLDVRDFKKSDLEVLKSSGSLESILLCGLRNRNLVAQGFLPMKNSKGKAITFAVNETYQVEADNRYEIGGGAPGASNAEPSAARGKP